MTADELLEAVKIEIGAPIMTIPELTDAKIEKQFITHALADYYRVYPLESHESMMPGTEINYGTDPKYADFIGVIGNSYMSYHEYPGQAYSDPFTLARSLVSMHGSLHRILPDNIYMRTLGVTAARPSYAIVHDTKDKKIKFESLFQGIFNVILAFRGTVEDVKPNDEWDMVKVAAAYLKLYLYKTRTYLDLSAMPIKLNFDRLREEAEKDIANIVGEGDQPGKWKAVNFLLMWS